MTVENTVILSRIVTSNTNDTYGNRAIALADAAGVDATSPERPIPMSSPAPSLADRLVMACQVGDLQAAQAAIADGASVNEIGQHPCGTPFTPLAAALVNTRFDVALWLLSQGADPNGENVMYFGISFGTLGIVQLLIDAGGDANRFGGEHSLLHAAIGKGGDFVQVLLAQPTVDLTIKYRYTSPERYARMMNKLAIADSIAQEVSHGGKVRPRPFVLVRRFWSAAHIVGFARSTVRHHNCHARDCVSNLIRGPCVPSAVFLLQIKRRATLVR